MTNEELILAHLILGTVRDGDLDIEENFFQKEEQRLIFREISNGNGSHDTASLSINLNGKVDPVYISSLLEGVPKSNAKNVPKYISQVKMERLRPKVLGLIERGAKSGHFEHDKIRGLYEAIDKLGTVSIAGKDVKAETLEELALMDIPEIDRLVHSVVERRGLALVGGPKGSGKSLFVTQLALHAASGKSPFIAEDLEVYAPYNVLLIQQEVSLAGMAERLKKMRFEEVFDVGDRFRQKTTAGEWWQLTEPADLAKLKSLLERYHPDILILDPLYTFFPKKVIRSESDKVISTFARIKEDYDLGLIVVHHYSNKENPEEVKHHAGRFMEDSNYANSADNLIGLDFLHPKYRNQALPLGYNHYAEIEFQTRHGDWPGRVVVERPKGCLLFRESSIWSDLGRVIAPSAIEELIAANDGEMCLKDVIEALAGDVSRKTIRRAIDECIERGSVEKETLTGKGSPKLLRLKIQ